MSGTAAVQDAIEAMLARYRGRVESPSREEIDAVYTDGCAAVLALETERLRIKRRLRAAVMDAGDSAAALKEASELTRRSHELSHELDQMKLLVRQLRTAVDWAQIEAVEGTFGENGAAPAEDVIPPGPPRRRFSRE